MVEPPAEGQSSNAQAVQAGSMETFRFFVPQLCLNGLIDPLYNVYCKTTTAKELWESLERKYKTEDAGTKKFVVARFLDYKMVDSRAWRDNKLLRKDFIKPGFCKKVPRDLLQTGDQQGHVLLIAKMPKRLIHVRQLWVDENVGHDCAKVSDVAVDNGHKLYMGNSTTTDIKGEGDVILKMTSEKELKLTNVFKDGSYRQFVLYKTDVEESTCQILISSGMSQDMWGEAILTATYLLNKIPRKEKEETPYELWIVEEKPYLSILTMCAGCLAKVAVPTPKAQKIGPKSVDCIFIGYAKNSTAYRFIVHESKNPDIQKNTIMESRNASFFENIFPCLSKGTDKTNEEESRTKKEATRLPGVWFVWGCNNEKSFGPDFVSFMVENEPTSYREAVTSSEGQNERRPSKVK
ncbi:retrotransposon protein, putative, ty1-copia subclass [Tanacetum coccineum]